MKKIISWGMMLAAAFTLTNCAKEIENPTQEPESVGYPFEIVASTVDTKTVNDGMSTKWVADDQINLFHAESGTIEYVNDTPYSNSEGHPFVVSDVVNGKFEGELSQPLDPQEKYDWYAFYPYSTFIKTPANTSSGYMPVGSKHNEVQTQTGNNDMTHIAGANYPVAGYATAVPANTTPEIIMSHLSSLIEIYVTNANVEDLTVTDIAFTAPVNIVGTYYINFAGDITPDSFIGSGADYVSNTASLKVNNGAAIAQNQSAKFYLAVRPFTAKSGEDLIVSVNGHSKTITLSKDVTFTAGKIKTLNFAYDKVEEPVEPEPDGVKTATISFASTAQRTSYSTDQQVWEQNGIKLTNKKAGSTSNVADYSNPARFYKNSTIEIEAPGKITKMVFNCKEGAADLKTAVGDNAKVSNNTTVTIELEGTSSTVTYKLTAGKVFVYSLVVNYEAGNSEGGETPEPEPEPVQLIMSDITCTAQTENSLTFTWSNVANATGYEVTCNNKTETVTSTEYTATDLKAGTQYEVSIKAIGDGVNYTTSAAGTAEGTTKESEQPGGGDEGEEPEQPSVTAKFVKVTSEPSDWSGTYLIVYESGNIAFDGSLTTLDVASNNKAVSITNSEIEATDAMENITFEVSKSGSSYLIKSKSGYYIGNTADSNKLNSSTSTKYTNTITLENDGVKIVGSGNSVLRYNATSGQTRFRYFKSGTYSNQKAIQLYKLEE